MIAAWMIYCVLCALGLSLAAVAAERTLLAGRAPVRHVWMLAVLMSIVVPAVAYRVASRPVAIPTPVIASDDHAVATGAATDSVAALSSAASSVSTTPRWNWRGALSRADAPLAAAWLTLSSVLIAHFLCGTIALAWMRRWWRRDTVQGIDVLVSEATGPALVGALSPAIVVPEWTLAMNASQVELMLRHEQEHRRARDGQLLTLAHFALIAMPWNVSLWWQLVRLRVAVELDCDARVLRDADARSYGDLLLEVARPRRRLALLGATAFAERASQLERRIRALGRRRGNASRRARVSAAVIGIVVISAAWVAPRPPAPPRSSAVSTPVSVAKPTLRDSVIAPQPSAALPETSAAVNKPTRSLDATKGAAAQQSPRTSKVPVDSARRAEIPPPVARLRDSASLPETLIRRQVPGPVLERSLGGAQGTDSTFARLFSGITLTPDQAAKARELLTQLEAAQAVQMSNTTRALATALPLQQAIRAQADSSLEALLTNDDDRATLRSRFTIGGGRGRSGGGGGAGGRGALVGDTVLFSGGGRGARVGGGGRGAAPAVLPDTFNFNMVARGVVNGVAAVATGVGGGRGGARGGGGDGPAAAVDLADFIFRRFFDGIVLTPQQEANARAIITKMQADVRAVSPQVPPPIITRPPFSNQVIMSPESAAAFASLLSNDADRATLASHIRVDVMRPRTPGSPPR